MVDHLTLAAVVKRETGWLGHGPLVGHHGPFGIDLKTMGFSVLLT